MVWIECFFDLSLCVYVYAHMPACHHTNGGTTNPLGLNIMLISTWSLVLSPKTLRYKNPKIVGIVGCTIEFPIPFPLPWLEEDSIRCHYSLISILGTFNWTFSWARDDLSTWQLACVSKRMNRSAAIRSSIPTEQCRAMARISSVWVVNGASTPSIQTDQT